MTDRAMMHARIRALEAEVERLKAANTDALKRLTSAASIADRNRLLRAQRDRLREAAKRYRSARINEDIARNIDARPDSELGFAAIELDDALAACAAERK